MPWLMPYKTKPDPALAARFHTLLDLPKETFGHAFAASSMMTQSNVPAEPKSATALRVAVVQVANTTLAPRRATV